MPPRKVTTYTRKKNMLKALEQSLGIVTNACRKAGISRKTHYNWYEKDKKYADSVDEIQEVAIDFAESSLHKQIKEGIPSSTIFYLKTKGKHRGYVEKKEISIEEFNKPKYLQQGEELPDDDE